MSVREWTPREIVAELDRYIVGQSAAKRAVAVALRNRIRRRRLPEALQEEIQPKNILMIGPTGVGKTEIARRLARLVNAPFIKVEATKFTEVGYIGRDVESMIRDLAETAVRMVREEKLAEVQDKAEDAANERILDALLPPARPRAPRSPLEGLFGGPPADEEAEAREPQSSYAATREKLRNRLLAGEMESAVIEVEVEESPPAAAMFAGAGMEEMGFNLKDLLGNLMPRRSRRRKLSVAEARRLLRNEEAQKLVDSEQVSAEAVHRCEQSGIIFLDEMDKIAGREGGSGPDVSREGVQRDLLPIVEGTTVMTKYGPVRTDHILFIAAGAFHFSKPSDLIPELQGRFPIRVELESLTREDFYRILVEPAHSLTRQYQSLLATEGVRVEFAEDGLRALADIACTVNEETENIGARRLHTMLERLLEEILFDAPDAVPPEVLVDENFVRERLAGLARDKDLSRYIL